MTRERFTKERQNARAELRIAGKATSEGQCETALRHLIRAEKMLSGSEVRRTVSDRHEEVYTNFVETCVRSKKLHWDPEDGTRADRLRWEKDVKKTQSVWRDKGLEGTKGKTCKVVTKGTAKFKVCR